MSAIRKSKSILIDAKKMKIFIQNTTPEKKY